MVNQVNVIFGFDQPLQQALPSEAPELIYPAGGWPQLRASIANGADAVYFRLT